LKNGELIWESSESHFVRTNETTVNPLQMAAKARGPAATPTSVADSKRGGPTPSLPVNDTNGLAERRDDDDDGYVPYLLSPLPIFHYYPTSTLSHLCLIFTKRLCHLIVKVMMLLMGMFLLHYHIHSFIHSFIH
jgi:hypothetical protein